MDPTANTATTITQHNQLPPLGIAIQFDFMDIWRIIRDQVELTDEAKLKQLYYMIAERRDKRPNLLPLKEFRELLNSLNTYPEWVSSFRVDGEMSLLQVAVKCNQRHIVRLLFDHRFVFPLLEKKTDFRSDIKML